VRRDVVRTPSEVPILRQVHYRESDQVRANHGEPLQHLFCMIRKLKSGEYRLYSRKKNEKTGKRRNLGTFSSLAAAKKHERAVQYFKRA
jgi:hypothetical protein